MLAGQRSITGAQPPLTSDSHTTRRFCCSTIHNLYLYTLVSSKSQTNLKCVCFFLIIAPPRFVVVVLYVEGVIVVVQ